MKGKRIQKKSSRALEVLEDVAREIHAQIMKPISTDLTVFRTLRFNSVMTGVASVSTAFQAISITNCMLVATTATAVTCLFEVFKIKEIRLRVFSSGSATATAGFTCTLTWNTGNVQSVMGDNRSVSCAGLGLTPAYVRSRPKKGSLQSMYQYGSTNYLFTIFTEQTIAANELNLMVEIDVLFRTNEQLSPVAAVNAGAGLTAGEWYYRGLDAQPKATTAWPPVGVANVA